MKIAFVADVHLGNPGVQGGKYVNGLNDRCRAVCNVLDDAMELAVSKGCDKFVICGDLFDTTKPPIQLVGAVAEMFEQYKRAGLKIFVLSGNHDQNSTAPEDNAVWWLCAAGLATVLDGVAANLCSFDECLFIPFDPDMGADELMLAVAGHEVDMLVTHFGIEDKSTPPWLKGGGIAHTDVFKAMAKCGAKWCFSGDWHNHKVWEAEKRAIFQVGALCPTGYNNPGSDYGQLLILDTGKQSVAVHAVDGPRFYKTSDPDEAETLMRKENNYVRLITDETALPAVLSSSKGRLAIEKPIKQHRDTKISYTRNGTIEEAISTYISDLGGENDDDREDAKRRCLTYI